MQKRFPALARGQRVPDVNGQPLPPKPPVTARTNSAAPRSATESPGRRTADNGSVSPDRPAPRFCYSASPRSLTLQRIAGPYAGNPRSILSEPRFLQNDRSHSASLVDDVAAGTAESPVPVQPEPREKSESPAKTTSTGVNTDLSGSLKDRKASTSSPVTSPSPDAIEKPLKSSLRRSNSSERSPHTEANPQQLDDDEEKPRFSLGDSNRDGKPLTPREGRVTRVAVAEPEPSPEKPKRKGAPPERRSTASGADPLPGFTAITDADNEQTGSKSSEVGSESSRSFADAAKSSTYSRPSFRRGTVAPKEPEELDDGIPLVEVESKELENSGLSDDNERRGAATELPPPEVKASNKPGSPTHPLSSGPVSRENSTGSHLASSPTGNLSIDMEKMRAPSLFDRSELQQNVSSEQTSAPSSRPLSRKGSLMGRAPRELPEASHDGGGDTFLKKTPGSTSTLRMSNLFDVVKEARSMSRSEARKSTQLKGIGIPTGSLQSQEGASHWAEALLGDDSQNDSSANIDVPDVSYVAQELKYNGQVQNGPRKVCLTKPGLVWDEMRQPVPWSDVRDVKLDLNTVIIIFMGKRAGNVSPRSRSPTAANESVESLGFGSTPTNSERMTWAECVLRVTLANEDETTDLRSNLSLVLLRCSQSLSKSMRQRRVLHIVHFNDVYNLNPVTHNTGGIVGGASRFHTVLSTIRQRSNPLVVFSGDFMGPSLMSVETKGKQMIDSFNLIGVNYGCFGNHEFDYGKKALLEAVHGYTHGPFVYTGSTTNWIMSNMTEADGTPLCGAKEYALTTWNGVRVGILGLCENWLGGCSQLKPEDAYYHDIFERGETMAQKLKSEGAEIVLALTHCRLNNDRRVAARCPSIDLVLGGHDHFYKTSLKNRVVKSGEEFQYLTEIKIDLSAPITDGNMSFLEGQELSMTKTEANVDHDEETMPIPYQTQLRSHPIVGSIPLSSNMEKVIKRYDAKLHERMGGVIGRTVVELDPTEACCRFQEGLLTGFVTDIMADQMKADFAILGGAAVSGKAKVPEGPITIGDVFGWFPNDTRVMCVRLLGSTVKKMLNVMCRDCPEEAPSFPHCSGGLSFTIDLFQKPPKAIDVKFKKQPLQDNDWYTVAVEDFAGKGSAKYSFIPKEGQVVVDDESAEQMVFWVIDYFQSKKGQTKQGAQATVTERPNADKDLEGSSGKLKKPRRSMMISGVFADQKLKPIRKSSIKAENGVYPVNRFKMLDFSASLDSETLARVYAATSILTDDVESVGGQVPLMMKVVSKLLKCEYVRIYLFDENSDSLRLVSPPYSESAVTRVTANSGTIAYLCISERACVNISHPHDKLFNAQVDDIAPGLENAPHVMNMLSVPIMVKKKPIAVIQAINKIQHEGNYDFDSESDYSSGSEEEKETFTEQDTGLALLIARQIGVQLHFSSIYSRMRRSEVARDALLEMALHLGRAEKETNVRGMILKIVSMASSMFNTDRAGLFLVDKGDLWTVVPSKDFTTEVTIRLPRGTGVAGQVVESGEMMNVHDAYLCKYFNPEFDRKTGYQTRTILAIPMMSSNRDDIIGVLQLINKKDGTVFDAADEELANNFCQLAAVAVHNSFEIETLRVGRDDSTLQVLPVHELNRIKIRGGWLTVKRNLERINSSEFKKKCQQSSRRGTDKKKNDIKDVMEDFESLQGEAVSISIESPQVDSEESSFKQFSPTLVASGSINSEREPSASHSTREFQSGRELTPPNSALGIAPSRPSSHRRSMNPIEIM